jgi:putative endopeptidase
MKDYYYLINNTFLKNLKLKDDESNVNISSFRYKLDKKLIDDIINKSEYRYLNEKEITILKKFNETIRNYDDNLNLIYIKNLIDNLLKKDIEELLVFTIKNKVDSIFGIDTLLHKGINYLYITQGKNNIPNTKLLENIDFLQTYKKIIKNIMSNFISIDDNILNSIVLYDVNLYKSRMSNSERRNVLKTFNKYKVGHIKFKNYDFQKMIYLLLKDVNVDIDEFILEDKIDSKYFTFIDNNINKPNFKYYLIWSLLFQLSLVSFGKLYDQVFEIVKIIRGIKKKMHFEKKIYFLNNYFIGHLISKEFFINIDSSVKNNIKKYINYIKKAFKNRLINNTWMDNTTKGIAIEKLDAIKEDIYESKLTDYNAMNKLTDIYYENISIINNYYFNKKMMSIKTKEKLFHGNTYNINAFYDASLNEIIFPYGILNPPYYYNNITDYRIIAYNFGAIGSVIGHEIIHGFDDQGRLFDKNGNLSDWWHPDSSKKYNELAAKIGLLYEEYNINSKLTMGENIADIGGVRISLSALILYLSDQNKKLNDDLLMYFIKGWAIIWRGKSTNQELNNRLINDPHSPIIQRVNIPLNNLKEIKDNNQDDIIEIW